MALAMLAQNSGRACLATEWSDNPVFELIALLIEAVFSWPMVPSDWPEEHRRLVHVSYLGLLGLVFVLGLWKLA